MQVMYEVDYLSKESGWSRTREYTSLERAIQGVEKVKLYSNIQRITVTKIIREEILKLDHPFQAGVSIPSPSE